MMCEAESLEQSLYDAAKWGRFDEVQSIIRSAKLCPEFNINYKNENGNTPLLIVCAWGYESTDYSTYRFYDIAKLLIECGADVNVANDKGQTPLFIAAAWGHYRVVELLILHGADLNRPDNSKLTALQIAAYARRVTPPEPYSSYTNRSKHHAYWSAKRYIVNLIMTREYMTLEPQELLNDYEMLIGYSATKPNESIPMEIMNMVVKYNHFAVVKLLLIAKADVNAPDERGYTALEKAERCGQSAMAQLLKDNGAVHQVPIKQEPSW